MVKSGHLKFTPSFLHCGLSHSLTSHWHNVKLGRRLRISERFNTTKRNYFFLMLNLTPESDITHKQLTFNLDEQYPNRPRGTFESGFWSRDQFSTLRDIDWIAFDANFFRALLIWGVVSNIGRWDLLKNTAMERHCALSFFGWTPYISAAH